MERKTNNTTRKTPRPKFVRIQCFDYAIYWEDSNKSDHGETNVDTKEIYINTKYPVQTQRETLLHEILHCVHDDNFALSTSYGGEDREEECIRHESPKILDTLRRNPRVLKFILG